MSRPLRVPKYRCYRPKNLGVVRLDGRDIYLGAFNSAESRSKYHRLIAEWLAAREQGQSPPPLHAAVPGDGVAPITINTLINAYRKFAVEYYVRDGHTTKEAVEMKYAARALLLLYGETLARDFGPLALKAVRQHMVAVEKLSRGVVNHRTNRIRRIFRWAVSEELVPANVFDALRALPGLRYGRTEAREAPPVTPVRWEFVQPVLPYMLRVVAAMVQVQYLTGMRPGEVVTMRACDIDATGDVWTFEPPDHKQKWRGFRRRIPLGPQSQALIKPFLSLSTQSYLFSPRQAEGERNGHRRAARKSPMTPSQMKRRPKAAPKRAKRERYDVDSYRRAIAYAIQLANKNRPAADKLPEWFPLQLRHTRATEIEKQFGIEAAQVSLGHARADVTQIYAERNLDRAVRVAREIG